MDNLCSDNKDSVELWRDSWFNLLLALRKVATKLDQADFQHHVEHWTYMGHTGRPVDRIRSGVKKKNAMHCIREIEKQLGMKKGLDAAMRAGKKQNS